MKATISGRNNYGIPCIYNISGNEKIIVIASHGFGSSKESPTILTLRNRLANCGIGFLSFDFPGHGKSAAGGEMLRIENCLDDLASAEGYAHALAPEAEIMYFSSSFGAYINLIYLAKRPHLGSKSFLRAAAVDMPGIIKSRETPELAKELKEQGFILMNEDYLRPLKVTEDFCRDLENNCIFSMNIPATVKITMIHGDDDETAAFEDAKKFAEKYRANLITVKGGNHRLMDKGQMKLVMDAAIEFFKGQ